ncbi:PREDICTED: uncharacterized protein LOC104814387 [Tarenaya hassleriana]|uniref:uncharacterized protein LOC104814387 n=1 Tax=Tarenaya hassleriana TaxID=28532 RepID=UPI00053C2654|nr:PREDICTED: uncharacterized protein LOC104814387 [Tarenaya hassleriana]
MECREMENGRLGFSSLALAFIFLLGFSAFVLCLFAEFHKAKRKDLKWDGEFCYLPGTHAFRLGIAALICVSVAQTVGNVEICRVLCRRDKTGSAAIKTPPFCRFLFFFSWISFAVAFALLATAASMNKEQRYGQGWLKRECYIVKNGVFSASSVLIVVTLAAVFGAAAFSVKPLQVETQEKLHTHTV